MKNSVRIIEGHRAKTVRLLRQNITASSVLASVSVLVAVLVCVAVVIPPFPWLPEVGEAESLLGTLLTAQAAITALTLAVTLFVVQGASSKRNSDDRMYREYVKRSWARIIFWSSISAVGVTGTALLAESFLGTVPPPAFTPGLRNLLLTTMPAFAANLILAALLLERTVRLTRPDNWQTIRREVNERDVREAVQIHVNRLRYPESEANSSVARFQYSGEGSASEAIRSLLDDGREAMIERRQRDFTQIFDSIESLIAYALDEISDAGFEWSAPGSQPLWPPIRELNSNLNSFREDVILREDQDFLSGLLSFDYWILRESVQRRCGELFTVALASDRQNYEIARRMGNGDLLSILRGRIWLNAQYLLSNAISEEDYFYFKQMVTHQERLLNGAMQVDSTTEYQRLHEGFEGFIRVTRTLMEGNQGNQAAEQVSRLEQDYRIALMGLGGRAALLAKSGSIVDPNPYLDVVRGKHNRVEDLADDIAKALELANDDTMTISLWDNWEMEQAVSYEAFGVYPEKYPLRWFAIRLIELLTEPQRTFNLHGKAKQILDWFERSSDGLETYVRDVPELNIDDKLEFAIAALQTAAHADEVAEDYAIIGSELSTDRVSAFKSDVYKAALATNSIRRLFERAGALLHIPSDADGLPDASDIRGRAPKVFLADLPENTPTHYVPLAGDRWGRVYSGNMEQLFCDALKQAPSITDSLNTPRELLQAVDTAASELNASGELAVLLVGDWNDIEIGLNVEDLDGYEPNWRVSTDGQVGELGRYRGHLIFRTFHRGERHLFVIDVATWGQFVDVELTPHQHMLVLVNPVSAERAREFLDANPELFSEQPDESSKLRKLQTLVEIVVRHRTEFRVSDVARARRISDVDETEQA